MRAFQLALIALTGAAAVFAQGGFTGPGRYEITNLKSGKVIGVERNGGSAVVQYSAQNGDHQAWDIQDSGSGAYFIRNAMSGDALEAAGNRNGTPLQAGRFNGGPAQQWRLERGKDGNALIVSSNGKTIDVPDGTSRDGERLQIYDLNGDSNQRFMLRRLAAGRSGRTQETVGGSRYGGSAASLQTLQCASDDGRRHYCAADTARGVRLTRQISGSPCRENETWGYDRQGVWVDRGCRAEFETGGASPSRFGRSSGSTSQSNTYTVRCASDDGRRNYCGVDVSRGVRLTRQVSGAACREGETWGYDRRGIWVDRGCRAEFEVGRR